MEIKNIGSMNLNFANNVSTRPALSFSGSESTSVIKKDSVELKSNTDKKPVKNAATSFGERVFNKPVLDHYLAFRNKSEYKPIVEVIDNLTNTETKKENINFENTNKFVTTIPKNVSIYEVESTAIQKAKEVVNPKNKKDDVKAVSMAYNSILSSVINNKYSDKTFFNGEKDKVFHYFVSGSLTLEVYKKIPLLPASLKREIAGATVLTIGWLKEVGSIPGNGFGHDDMQANRMGIQRAKDYLKSIDK